MEPVNIYEAKTQLSKYVEMAESGQDVIIARGGKQVARLVTAGKQHRAATTAGGYLIIVHTVTNK